MVESLVYYLAGGGARGQTPDYVPNGPVAFGSVPLAAPMVVSRFRLPPSPANIVTGPIAMRT